METAFSLFVLAILATTSWSIIIWEALSNNKPKKYKRKRTKIGAK